MADPARRLRIGFVSADLGRHPVGFFLRGVLPHLDRELLDIFCYSDRVVEDEITAELKTAADHWCFTAQMTTSQLVRRIKSDRIDILVDLSGHTAKNRLPVFARRAAPVQVSWAGYAGTTGLSQMDYLIADARHVPAGEEADYSEQIERLPETYVCYAPPDYAPEVSELPALARGYVTFGCFNNLMKVNRSVVAAWARILAAIPSARLVLKTRELADANVCGEYAHRFAELGIDPSRVDLLGPSCHADLLAHYGEIDIALDPFPYSGGLTTLEALWMGVPVITLRGSTFAGRHSASHLGVVGLDEWIAADSEEYKQRAIALAGHPDLLAAIRRTLRRRLLESPLCDGKSFARELETACRRMWTAWCNKGVQKDCLAASAASGEIRKVAVITPYYRESVQVLRRCHESVLGQSVPCTHFMIADGQPSEHVGGWQVRHLVLPESHNDNGNTPRTAGTVAAIEEGFDAIACLDADNWFYPDHLQRMIALHRRTGAAVCTAGRSVHNSEGRQLLQRTARDESDGTEFVDTSCLFLTREAFRIAPLWSAMPAESGPYCDRIFWRAVRREGLATAHSPEPTVAFVSQYAAHYERAGEPVPVGSKTAADMAMRLATVGEPASWEESRRYLGAAFGAINLGDPKNETI